MRVGSNRLALDGWEESTENSRLLTVTREWRRVAAVGRVILSPRGDVLTQSPAAPDIPLECEESVLPSQWLKGTVTKSIYNRRDFVCSSGCYLYSLSH